MTNYCYEKMCELINPCHITLVKYVMILAVCDYLDARRHGDVEVAQNMLCVLVFGAFAQKR